VVLNNKLFKNLPTIADGLLSFYPEILENQANLQ
jgi:hypothetical protein